MFLKTFLGFPLMPWSSHSCNDRRYSYFTGNICNRYVDSFVEHDRMQVLRLLRLIESRLKIGFWTTTKLLIFWDIQTKISQNARVLSEPMVRKPFEKHKQVFKLRFQINF